MLFIYYLDEVKYRIFYCCLSFFFNFLGWFLFIKELLFIIVKPLINLNQSDNFSYFIFTDMLDIFTTYFKIIFLLSLVSIFPVLFIQLWFFLVQGLHKYEKNFLLFFLVLILFFLVVIFLLLYIYLIPSIWLFFVNFELTSDNSLFGVYYEAHISKYVDFLFNIFYLFFCLMQVPIFLIFLLYFDFIKVNFFIYYRKYFIIIFFIFGGIFSPPDILSQIFISFFVLFIYEIILFCNLLSKNYINEGKKKNL